MKAIRVAVLVSVASSGFCAHAQTPPQTEEELTKQTALLKAQAAYYDQQAATAKSQQAVADANIAAQTTSLTAATALKSAQYAGDLALATALKGSGLTAATGKDGTITVAAGEKMMLALQADSLAAIDLLVTDTCSDLKKKLKPANGEPVKAFFAPPNYELLVERSVVDVVQLMNLHAAAKEGIEAYKSVQMEVATTAIAGALMSAQYLAGGVQAITKLFRTDYNLSYTPANRQALFEQALSVSCKDVLNANVEAALRMNAARILNAWLPHMAQFVQLHEGWVEQVATSKATRVAQKTTLEATKPTTDKDKKSKEATLAELKAMIEGFEKKEAMLARFKPVATTIKNYLGQLGTGTIYDSLVWGQQFVHEAGGLPASVVNLKVETLNRITYTLNVQDTSIKASSTFSADKLRYFATAELYYSVAGPQGEAIAAGAMSKSTKPTDLEIKSVKGVDYKAVY